MKLISVIAAALVVAVLGGCGRYAPRFLPGDTPEPAALVGVWVHDDASLTLEPNGTAVLAGIPEGFLVREDPFVEPSQTPTDAIGSWSLTEDEGWWSLHYLSLQLESPYVARVVIDPGGLGLPIRLCFERGDPDAPETFCLSRKPASP